MEADVDDAYLVRRAQEGYLEAYSELVRRHGGRAYRVALRLLGNPQDAEDIAQESLVAAWQQLPRFKADAQFTTWLFQIVTRRALNRLTRTRSTSELPESGVDANPGPYQQAERTHKVDAVHAAITQLPPAQRVVIVLHHLEELPVADVAVITGMTPASVRSHLFRARRTLVATLRDWG